MYLSRLEMVGFKSFGLKTDLTFNDGVTAIVGPNGCGKTNIVDAIRWVLGEQKTSMLRADSMEHVIFNGSKNRKPLGMAEVSLTIENNKHILPTEYSQVVITRRLFRNGESQYLLNRTACRLKDIIELFMDTGMGANAYSVIELKMIETILSDKADERRHLFEEAAGVTKYKVRRKEAQRKLEAAQKDISRVQDIVREVQKTVNSLARQAEKARQHQDISVQLRSLDRDVFVIEYRAATEQLTILNNRRAEIASRQTIAEGALVAMEQSVAQAEVAHQETEQKFRLVIDAESNARAAMSGAVGQSSVLAERIAATERAIERLERENSTSETEQSTMVEQLGSVRSKLVEVSDQVTNAHQELASRKSHASDAHTKLSEVRQRLFQARNAVQGIQQQQNELGRERDKARFQSENLHRRIADTTHGVEQQQEKQAQLQSLISAQASELPGLEQSLLAAEHTLQSAESRQRELRALQEQQQTSLDSLRTTEAHTRASLEFLVGLVDTTESSKFLMNSDEWKPSGEKLTLAEVLNTSDELRVAIEAALGDAAKYFVVANRAEADQAIQALSRNNIGKATFLCKDAIPSLPEPPSLSMREGIRGWASELVEADATLRGAVRSILGRIVVAADLDAAWKAVQIDGIDRAVTMAGEVVHRAGAVRGGSKTQTEGIRVGRRERIVQTQKQLDTLAEQISAGQANAQLLKDEYSSIDLRALSEIVRQATVSRNTVQQRIDSLTASSTELNASINKLHAEVAAYQAELQVLGKSYETAEEHLNALQEQLIAATQQATICEQDESAANAQLQLATEQVRDAEILAVRLDGELASLTANEARLSDQSLTIDQRREQRTAEVGSLSLQHTQLQKELELAKQSAEELAGRLATIVAQRSGLELTLQEDITAANAASETLRKHRRELDSVVAEFHATEIEVTGATMRIEALEKHAREELELTGELNEYLAYPSSAELNAESEHGNGNVDSEPSEGEEQFGDDGAAYRTSVEHRAVPSADELRQAAQELRRKLTLMGNVNFLALEEHERESERLQFMSTQLSDLLESERTLSQTILEINHTARDLFTGTFEKIRTNFTDLFKVLFSEDDEADLQMLETEDNDPLECKIDIIAKPRGKRPHSIEMLSGGEKTLTAIALLFAIYLVKPSPFCILDEVDAPLDDANIDRYLKIIRKFSANTQFLMITHNKRTMESADTLYGVTMQEPAVSKVVSVQLGNSKSAEVQVA